jgi:hypothetical protein
MMDIDRKIEDAVREKFEPVLGTPHIRLVSGALEKNPELRIYESIMKNSMQRYSAKYESSISFGLYLVENRFEAFTAQCQHIVFGSGELLKAVWLNVERVNRYVIIDLLHYCEITGKPPTDFLLKDF